MLGVNPLPKNDVNKNEYWILDKGKPVEKQVRKVVNLKDHG